MKLKKRYVWALILCCYCAAVLYLCLADTQQIPAWDKMIWNIPADKIGHFLMFLPYPLIAYIAFKPATFGKWRHLMVLLAVFALGTGLAMGTEQLQGLSQYRSYEIEDFYADVLGMECMTVIIAIMIILKKEKRNIDL